VVKNELSLFHFAASRRRCALTFPVLPAIEGLIMFHKKPCLPGLLALPIIAMLMNTPNVPAQDKPTGSAPDAGKPQPVATSEKSARAFDEQADKALLAMQQRAAELKVTGVAVVAYSEGDRVKSWSSKMVVVGNLKTSPSQNDPAGANLLGIAYAKAAEMADTLKNSGSAGRPPMKGEFGWQGGVVAKGQTGILIAAFSGGPSADDVKISQAGLAVLSQ
jgi:hypothetical protein